MKRFSGYCLVSLALFNVVINAAIVINRSEKGWSSYATTFFGLFLLYFDWNCWIVPFSGFSASRTTKSPASKTAEPSAHSREQAVIGRKLSRRDRCCNLGREVAKIGETCTYTPNVDHIYPDSHFHQMKTSVWTRRSHPIKRRLLQKCKPFKVFYEKCCHYEYSLITKDLLQQKRRIKQYLREIRKNEVVEDEGSSNEQGGLPREGQKNSEKET